MDSVQTGHPAGVATAPPGPAPMAVPVAPDFLDWLERSRAEVDAALAAHFRELEIRMGPHSRLPAAVQYSVTVGGKRLRPLLVLESCRVCGGRREAALPAALALELVHTFSLIHDDLPAMDDDDTRRGQPTNHKVFGEGMAVLAGDWLVTHALELVAGTDVPAETAAALVRTLAGGTRAMIEGQGADLDGERQPARRELVEYIHEHKTAALLETSCRLGALCAGAPEETTARLAAYGRHLGLAFQIVDDLLDATGSAEDLGKGVRKDAAAGKQTYPAAFGLDESRRRAEGQVDAALRQLDPFGEPAERLRDLARYVLRRDR